MTEKLEKPPRKFEKVCYNNMPFISKYLSIAAGVSHCTLSSLMNNKYRSKSGSNLIINTLLEDKIKFGALELSKQHLLMSDLELIKSKAINKKYLCEAYGFFLQTSPQSICMAISAQMKSQNKSSASFHTLRRTAKVIRNILTIYVETGKAPEIPKEKNALSDFVKKLAKNSQ